jgi:hypothetical protein
MPGRQKGDKSPLSPTASLNTASADDLCSKCDRHLGIAAAMDLVSQHTFHTTPLSDPASLRCSLLAVAKHEGRGWEGRLFDNQLPHDAEIRRRGCPAIPHHQRHRSRLDAAVLKKLRARAAIVARPSAVRDHLGAMTPWIWSAAAVAATAARSPGSSRRRRPRRRCRCCSRAIFWWPA